MTYIFKDSQGRADVAIADLCNFCQNLALNVHLLLLCDLFQAFNDALLLYLTEVYHDSLGTQFTQALRERVVADENYWTWDGAVLLLVVGLRAGQV